MIRNPQFGLLKVFLTPVPNLDYDSKEWKEWCDKRGIDIRGNWIASASCYLRGADVLVSDVDGSPIFDVRYMEDGDVVVDARSFAADGLSNTDRLLLSLYSEFCEECYRASWMTLDDGLKADFADWLALRLRTSCPDDEGVEMLPALRDVWNSVADELVERAAD